MTTEQPKAPPPPPPEHMYAPAGPYPPQPYNGTYPPLPPPGAYPPQYFAYHQPPDGNHAENGQNGAPPGQPYMMTFAHPAPGMIYAYPPPPNQGFVAPQNNQPSTMMRPKRKQVKMACTNCAAACKRCDEHRPCERCMKYGVGDTCIDGQRKERKKGIKRGPYKRKSKAASEQAEHSHYASPEGDWPAGSPPPATTATTAAAMHAVAHQFPPHDGYYPVYYPPPFMPHPHEGHPGPENSPPHGNGQPPAMPYYIHPGGYPPYPHYGHPGHMYPPHAGPPPPQQPPPPQAQVTEPPAAVAKESPAAEATNGASNGAESAPAGKKKGRRGGEPKSKKAKVSYPPPPETADPEQIAEGEEDPVVSST